ncbi:MAG: hypothetical protein JWM11_6402 [Planctomycetaceae bacterium]|nr:hypothetical protein [Planctomycetaceae bacterium]
MVGPDDFVRVTVMNIEHQQHRRRLRAIVNELIAHFNIDDDLSLSPESGWREGSPRRRTFFLRIVAFHGCIISFQQREMR